MLQPDSTSLYELLAAELPQGSEFKFYHLSTPPTKCAPLFSPPPGRKPEPTCCECHFLNVSIKPKCGNVAGKEVLVLAVEVLIYTTKHLTTVFVSKADSTGCLSLLDLPPTQASPLRSITTTFLTYLIRHKQRQHVRLVLTLFARAADQYLFPGSVENPTKHVSDDRQLIKWWLRVLDPLISQTSSSNSPSPPSAAQAFVTVPGEDSISAFLPKHVRSDPSLRNRWKHGHPLRETSRFGSTAPPRCLVPHFPDDPKARFLDELDEELRDAVPMSQVTESPSKRGSGQWRSVRSLEQFWELMAFRQECSSGRLVGFVWIVFTPAGYDSAKDIDSPISPSEKRPTPPTGDSFTSQVSLSSYESSSSNIITSSSLQTRLAKQRARTPLTGLIIPRIPRIKKSSNSASTSTSSFQFSSSNPPILLPEKQYKKAIEILLRLDFSNPNLAATSTTTWVSEVGILAGQEKWGRTVVGRRSGSLVTTTEEKGVTALIGRKRKIGEVVVTSGQCEALKVNGLEGDSVMENGEVGAALLQSGVNVLGAGLVRKKLKSELKDNEDGVAVESQRVDAPLVAAASSVNVLGPGLVRKKPRA